MNKKNIYNIRYSKLIIRDITECYYVKKMNRNVYLWVYKLRISFAVDRDYYHKISDEYGHCEQRDECTLCNTRYGYAK